MHHRFPFLNALRSFEAACSEGSLTGAATALSVTPGAVSRQVRKLEDELGCPLLVRQARGVEPTAKGHVLHRAIGEAFDRIDATLAEIRDDSSMAVLSVFSYITVAVEWLVPRIGSFHRAHPHTDLQLYPVREPAGLFDGTMDAGVWYGPGDWPDVNAVELVFPEYLPVCSPRLIEEGPPLLCPDDLKNHQLLASSFQLPFWQAWLKAAGVTNLDLSAARAFDSSAQVYHAARDGQGIALGQRAFVCNDVAAGTLVVPFDVAVRDNQAYCLISLKERRKDPRIKAFQRWIETQLEEAERVARSAMPSGMTVVPMDRFDI